MDFSLTRIRTLLNYFNNPQNDYQCIHVAGTNGKGSVTSYIESIFLKLNDSTNIYPKLKIGKFNSPHLLTENDAIRINRNIIELSEYNSIQSKIQSVELLLNLKLTNFEVTTCIMYIHFSQQKVDLAIIEVGLGGLLDATNVISNPLLCVFCSISMDHEAILGDTVQEIALQKAGILKKGVKVVIGQQEEKVMKVLTEECNRMECKYVISTKGKAIEDYQFSQLPPKGRRVEYISKKGNKYDLILNLNGEFQLMNLGISIECMELIENIQGYEINKQNIINGIKDTVWPGRIEFRKYNQMNILCDGAHNPAAAIELNKFITKMDNNRKFQNIYWILSTTKGKDFKSNFEYLVTKELKEKSDIYLTKFSQPMGMPWIQTEELEKMEIVSLKLMKDKNKIKKINDIEDCFKDILKKVEHKNNEDSIIIVTGSLYLVSDLFRFLKKE
ncbi:FolC bifunctional protein [Neoconidiobolus thromboides FSU 785]|nr:FolC bifunctional protein [Neoconidiobolus thromboides FSU 785]